MFKSKTYKPKRVIHGYEIRRQQCGLHKIVEYSYMDNNTGFKKRTIEKNLTYSDAENKLYQLEKKVK